MQKMANNDTIFGYHPVGTPTCLCKPEVGKSRQNTAQPCARAQSGVNNDLRADRLQKGWGLRVSIWNVHSLTGRASTIQYNISLLQSPSDRYEGDKIM